MKDREKFEKVLDLIQRSGVRDGHITPDEMYAAMSEYNLLELSKKISLFVNLIADIQEVLKEDDFEIELKESDILEVTLLSVEEAIKIPRETREAECSWWLRSPGDDGSKAAVVNGGSGYVYDNGSYVENEFGVRPALKLKSSHLKSGDSFSYGGYRWIMITDDTALCKTIVGKCAFREDFDADDANDYESSDIKKWLDGWWQKVRDKCR